MAGGEAEANDVYKAGDKAGFSKDTLKRAKRRARVKSEKDHFDAGWMWRLADDEESTKGAKSAQSETLLPSLPSVLPSESAGWGPCAGCDRQIMRAVGVDRCPECRSATASRLDSGEKELPLW
ncbi:hypothetical protein ACVCAH_27945 [Micromonospora sp. LZ34]